jgi:alpha-tubulin suppressor-like RCC1 family protein
MKKTLLFFVLLAFSNVITAQCYEQITFGGAHTIGKRSNGTLWGWGSSSWGNLCTNNSNELEPLPNIKAKCSRF